MINPANGHIALDGEEITPDMTPDDFTAAFDDAHEHTLVDRHPAYNVLREVDDQLVGVTARFEDDQLSSATLAISEQDELKLDTADEAYEQREQERHARHEAWLQKWFGHAGPYNFNWGSISAILDPHYGNAYITIDYATDTQNEAEETGEAEESGS